MYAIYGNIYHQYTPNVTIYSSTMDPMGLVSFSTPTKIYTKLDMSLRIISGRMETTHFSKTHDIMKTLLVGTLW
jgi:hypothetical protein